MQDERLVTVGLDRAGQVGLFLGRIDVRVLVVLEDAEVAVQAYVDAGRLDHRSVERVQLDPLGVELGQDVAVGEQHAGTVAQPSLQRAGRTAHAPLRTPY